VKTSAIGTMKSNRKKHDKGSGRKKAEDGRGRNEILQ
jgi:hypothetical protein